MKYCSCKDVLQKVDRNIPQVEWGRKNFTTICLDECCIPFEYPPLGEDRKWCVRLYLVFYLFDTIMQILLILKCFYVNNNYSLAFIIIFFLLAYSESCKAGEYIHQFISRFVSTTQNVYIHRHTQIFCYQNVNKRRSWK